MDVQCGLVIWVFKAWLPYLIKGHHSFLPGILVIQRCPSSHRRSLKNCLFPSGSCLLPLLPSLLTKPRHTVGILLFLPGPPGPYRKKPKLVVAREALCKLLSLGVPSIAAHPYPHLGDAPGLNSWPLLTCISPLTLA